MAFGFSMSKGFDAKDFVAHVEFETSMELPANKNNLFLFVNPQDNDPQLTINLEDGQAMFVANTNTDGFSFDLADKSDPSNVTTLSNGEACVAYLEPFWGVSFILLNDN